jgi:hypothetical protein
MTSVFLVPLVALVCLRYVWGELDGSGLVARLGPLLAVQVSFSTEIAFTLTLTLAVCIVAGFALVPDARSRIGRMFAPVLGAYAVGAVLMSPLLYYLFTDFHREAVNAIGPADLFGLDLLNLVVPTRLSLGGGWAHPISRHFLTGFTEGGAYLGLPVVIALGWLAVRGWRRPGVRVLFAALAVCLVASFGTYLHVRGHRVAPMPWEHIGYLALFNQVLPVRLSMYIELGAAVGVALWATSSAPRWARIALPALAVVFLLPDLGLNVWASRVAEPSFITAGTYKHCLKKGSNVLVLPFGEFGNSMLWQAQTGFWFRQAGGHLAPGPPKAFESLPVATFGKPAPLRDYIAEKHVDAVVVDERTGADWLPFLEGAPERVGGVLLYSARCTL